MLFLPRAVERAENGCVQFRKPCTALFILALVAGWRTVPAVAQSSAAQAAPQSKPVPPPAARVDINHASLDELSKIPGMTPTWAGRIVRFRPYRTKRDLLDQGVLSADVYDRIKDWIIAHRGEQ